MIKIEEIRTIEKNYKQTDKIQKKFKNSFKNYLKLVNYVRDNIETCIQ